MYALNTKEKLRTSNIQIIKIGFLCRGLLEFNKAFIMNMGLTVTWRLFRFQCIHIPAFWTDT